MDNILLMIAKNQAAGVVTVISEILVRSGWTPLTGPQSSVARRKLHTINRWLRETVSAMEGVFIAYPNKYISDPSTSNGDPFTGYLIDGLHPNPLGAYFLGKAFFEALDLAAPPSSAAMIAVDDVYDATDNVTGNLLTGALMKGTAGTISSGASGTLATGWTFAQAAGSTAGTLTAQARTDGKVGREQLIDFSGVSGAALELFTMSQLVAAGNYAAGDELVAELEIELTSSQNLCSIALQLYDLHGGIEHTASAGGPVSINTAYLPFESHIMRIRTPILVPTAGTTFVKFEIDIHFNANVGAQTFSLRVRNASLRKVV